MIPTKPISPLTATAAAVPTVAQTTTASRTRPTWTPRLAASSSPTLSTSSSRRWSRIPTVAITTYGSRIRTSRQPELGRRPRIHEYTSWSVSEFCCWTNVCTAVKNEATVTPASTSVAPRAAARAGRPPDRVRGRDGDGPAGERGRRQDGLIVEAARQVDDRDRRPEPGPGGDAEQVRVGERIAEDALVRGAGHRQHRADERAEHDARQPDVPEDRLLGQARAANGRAGTGAARRPTPAPPPARCAPARRGPR